MERKMLSIRKTLLMTGCILATSLTAQTAQVFANGVETAFIESDRNKDGALDEKEFRAHQIIGFDLLDTDEDGNLSISECENGCITDRYKRDGEAYTDYMFSTINSDGNSLVEENEYLSYMDEKFRLHDRNQNGFLEESEFYSFYYGKDQRNFIAKKTIVP
jgi:Ca2+-binding EF-hand superfamily protein